MLRREIMGKNGLALAVIASLAMAAVAFFVDAPVSMLPDTGLCCASPNSWGLRPGLGWFLNTLFLALACVILADLNKRYHLVPGTDNVTIGMFLIMAASNVWVSGIFTSTGIMAIVNLVCVAVLFGCYNKHNATKDLFIIASILSFGSMIQYGFVFLMPVYLIGAIIMKCFDFKVICAYLMGLVAPYWIVLGFGLVAPGEIGFPRLSHVFESIASNTDIFFGLLNVALTSFIGVILALLNSIRVYSGNTKKRACNAVINLLGVFILACLVFDFENMIAYLATLYLIVAIQLGNMFELGNVRRGELWLLLLSALYIAGFVMMIVR